MSSYPKTARYRVILWAYQAPINGNSQSVDAARRCLLFLASVCNLHEFEYLSAYYQTRDIAAAAGLHERTTQRALNRLVRAGLIRRLPGRNYGVQYSGEEEAHKQGMARQRFDAWNRSDAEEQPRIFE